MRNLIPCLLPLAIANAAIAQDAMPNFGHARARELAALGRLPSGHDIVVRDVVNYHRHRLPLPRADQAVALDLRFDRAAADLEDLVTLQVGYTTQPQADRAFAGPCSVALVVDVSGSMQERGKLDQVQAGLREFAHHLRADDEVALIAFSSEARVLAPRRAVGNGTWLVAAIDELHAEGSTNLHDGLLLGLRELSRNDAAERPQRVILLTDGIANTGVVVPAEILAAAKPFTDARIDISTIGLGEDLDVSLLEQLARGTRGLFHFVADERDVQKIFAEEADSLLLPIARRPQLVITLPEGLEVERVFQDVASRRRDTLTIALPDLNAGVTGVVLLECRVTRSTRGPLTARADLSFEIAATRGNTTEHAAADLRHGVDRSGTPDLEVQKNHAIAVLAQGLRDMAEACDGKRWADADRALRLAQDRSRQLFPGDDPDLQRVREIASGHARTLLRYVDRFRDY